MPWKPEDALKHNKKATTKTSQKAFAAASNSVLEKTGDEGRAVAAGNAAVNKSRAKSLRIKNGQNLGTKGGGFKPLSGDLKRNLSRKRTFKA